MAKVSTLTFAEAAPYDDAFQACIAGTATIAQAREVHAVISALAAYINQATSAAATMINDRDRIVAIIPQDKAAQIAEVLDGKGATPPRIEFDPPIKAEPADDEAAAAVK